MIVYNEVWTLEEQKFLKDVLGKTLDEAKAMYPDWEFITEQIRGEEEDFLDGVVCYKTNAKGKLTHIAFG
jgi:hypothetical protein